MRDSTKPRHTGAEGGRGDTLELGFEGWLGFTRQIKGSSVAESGSNLGKNRRQILNLGPLRNRSRKLSVLFGET